MQVAPEDPILASIAKPVNPGVPAGTPLGGLGCKLPVFA